jgi:hypothetical protein
MKPVVAPVAFICMLLKFMVFNSTFVADVVIVTVIVVVVMVYDTIVTSVPVAVTVPIPGLN